MLIAIFIGIQLVYKEVERRTIYSLLSKPVTRAELILGKFMGLAATLFVNSAVMFLGICFVLFAMERGPSSLFGPVLAAAVMILVELTVITAIALTLSAISSPALSATLTFMLFVVGHFTPDFKLMAAASSSAATSTLLYALYYLLPNLTNFNRISAAAYGDTIPARDVLMAIVYAAVYCGVLLSIAVIAFRAREFK